MGSVKWGKVLWMVVFFWGVGARLGKWKTSKKKKSYEQEKDFRSPVELQAERQTWNKRWKCTGLGKRKKGHAKLVMGG